MKGSHKAIKSKVASNSVKTSASMKMNPSNMHKVHISSKHAGRGSM